LIGVVALLSGVNDSIAACLTTNNVGAVLVEAINEVIAVIVSVVVTDLNLSVATGAGDKEAT
jgi:hypothetical protein